MPDDALYASVCDAPDADELRWSDTFYVGEDVMMNKPTVLSTGEWYFPVAVWLREMRKVYGIRYQDMSVQEIAERLGASAYYIMHQFKNITGTTIVGYKKEP